MQSHALQWPSQHPQQLMAKKNDLSILFLSYKLILFSLPISLTCAVTSLCYMLLPLKISNVFDCMMTVKEFLFVFYSLSLFFIQLHAIKGFLTVKFNFLCIFSQVFRVLLAVYLEGYRMSW